MEVEAHDHNYQLYHLPCYHRLQRSDHTVTTYMLEGCITNNPSALLTSLSPAMAI